VDDFGARCHGLLDRGHRRVHTHPIGAADVQRRHRDIRIARDRGGKRITINRLGIQNVLASRELHHRIGNRNALGQRHRRQTRHQTVVFTLYGRTFHHRIANRVAHSVFRQWTHQL